jgi:hypothetical protein
MLIKLYIKLTQQAIIINWDTVNPNGNKRINLNPLVLNEGANSSKKNYKGL